MPFVCRVVLDFVRRRRLLLGLLGGYFLLGALVLASEYRDGRRMLWLLAYLLASAFGATAHHFDESRGWLRAVRQLPQGNKSAATLYWCIHVGVPTLGILFLCLPAAVLYASDQYDFWMFIILPIFGFAFASASMFHFVFALVPKNRSRDPGKRSMPRVVLMLVVGAIWFSGFAFYSRWADSGRWDTHVFPYYVMVGLLFSAAGSWQVRSAVNGTRPTRFFSQERRSGTAKSRRKALTAGLSGWGHLFSRWIVGQVGLASVVILTYLLYEAVKYSLFGDVMELKFATAEPSMIRSILLACPVTLGYALAIGGISSTRILRTLPLSPLQCSLNLLGLATGTVLSLVALTGLAFFLIGQDNGSIGWFLCFLGAVGPASLTAPCALYMHDTVVGAMGSSLLVLAATVIWMYVASPIGITSLALVAPLVAVGGTAVSLLLVSRILVRSSRAYRGQVHVIQ